MPKNFDDINNQDDKSFELNDDFSISDDFILSSAPKEVSDDSEKDYDLDLWSSYAEKSPSTDDAVNDEDDDVIYSSSEKEEEAKLRQGIVTRHTGKEKNKNKKKKMGKLKKTILSVFLILFITVCLVISVFSIYVFAVVDDDVDFDLNNLSLNYSSVIYAMDRDTKEYTEYYTLHGTENRIWIDSSEFSPYMCDAIVAIEDKRFYDHEGVDWKRTFSAFVNMFIDLYGGTQGGSTITQQLIKNITGDRDQTPQRKIQEIMRARNIEKNYTKPVILECYANTVHFGNGCDGVQVAAQYYFGKDASELSLLECASLAATIQTPANINPIDGPEENKERRETCLALMLEQEFISEEEYNQALAEELVVVDHSGAPAESEEEEDESGEETEEETSEDVYDYFVETLIDDVIEDLVNIKGYSEEEAQKLLFSGGLQIYSTVDPYVQTTMEEVFADDDYFSGVGDGEVDPQAAMTLMDYSGHIIGIMGGRGEKTANRVLNRATDSTRQPGSSIKPLGAYSPAIEYNLATYSTYIEDAPIKVNGKNYPDYGSYANVTLQNALSRSLNCVAVRLVQNIGIERSYEFIQKRYHISTLIDSYTNENGDYLTDYTLSSLALGGMVHGVTTTEMTAAYAAFGNLGVYWEPTTYTKIENTFGDEILIQNNSGEQIISQETANIMNEVMQTAVTGSGGTARPAAFGSWPIFAKTGTTNDNYDRWIVAGTPYYVAACWYGYDIPADMGGTSYNPCIYFWKPIMQRIHEDLELCDFSESGGVSYRYYCTDTGLVATDKCENVALGFYKNSYAPECTTHRGIIRPAVTKPSPAGGKFKEIYTGGMLPTYNEAVNSTAESSEVSSEETSSVQSEEASSQASDTATSVAESKPESKPESVSESIPESSKEESSEPESSEEEESSEPVPSEEPSSIPSQDESSEPENSDEQGSQTEEEPESSEE